jgi:putative transposase
MSATESAPQPRPSTVPKGSAEMVAVAIRIIFAQPKADMVRDQLGVIAAMLGRQSTKVETMLRDAAEDLLAFTSFPPAHWKKIWSPTSSNG